MADIQDRLGSAFADRMVAAFGGRRIYVPFRMPYRGRLFEALSVAEITSLIGVCGGAHVCVPIGRGNAYGRARNKAQAMIRDGVPAHEIASRVGISVRGVYYIKRAMSAPSDGPAANNRRGY